MNDLDPKIIAKVTTVVRKADKLFESVGGSSRHWVRDYFLPLLQDSDLMIISSDHECAENIRFPTSKDYSEPMRFSIENSKGEKIFDSTQGGWIKEKMTNPFTEFSNLKDAVNDLVAFAESGGNDRNPENQLEYARLFEKMVMILRNTHND